MDINSILSGGPADKSRQQQDSPSTGREGSLATPGRYGLPSSQQHLSLNGPSPPAGGPVRPPLPGAGLTPLATQHQPLGPGQSPLSHHHSQSPASAWLTTPGGRPNSGGQPFAPPPTLHHQSSRGQGTVAAQGPSSHSPTPSSHPSQTPHSARHSPRSVLSQHPPSQPPYQYHLPSTPIAPPSLQHQRSATFTDMHSPSHHRTTSGASSLIMPNSPAHQHLYGGHSVGSPGTYAAPSPTANRGSDQVSRASRERSVSVSPKTKVPSHLPSVGSRQSSQHDILSARSSIQMGGPGSPSHSLQPQRTTPGSQSNAPMYPIPASDVSQPSPVTGAPGVGSTAGASVQKAFPQVVSHQSQKMDMNHLLTPRTEVPAAASPSTLPSHPQGAEQHTRGIRSSGPGSSPQVARQAVPAVQPSDFFPAQHVTTQHMMTSSPIQSQDVKAASGTAGDGPLNSRRVSDQRQALKRSADSELTGHSSKIRRVRKYPMTPAWGQYSKHNSRFSQQQQQPQLKSSGAFEGSQHQHNALQVNGGTTHGPNEQPSVNLAHLDDRHPWLHNPPLDFDLIHTRKQIGAWEKTFMWNTPLPDLHRAVQDWMFVTLDGLQDVGWNPQEGEVEIEAKIGTLIDRDDQRCSLPVATTVLLNHSANKNYRFESQMTEAEHKAMNEFLNTTIRATMQKGRVPMSYQHLYELDSFRELSSAGVRAIPAPLQRRQGARMPRMRTTTELDKHGNAKRIKARIVKVNIDNIHIFNPTYRYDCRISINLEVNLDQPQFDPAELIVEPTEARPTEPNRNKDRMSYKHLAYSIDLTQVNIEGMPAPKHELELEVDAKLLREHQRLLKEGQPNAFGDILSGFLDNATYLMRQRA